MLQKRYPLFSAEHSSYLGWLVCATLQIALLTAADNPPPRRSLWKSLKRAYQFTKENPELIALAKDAQQYLPRDATGKPIITKQLALKTAAAVALDIVGEAMKESAQELTDRLQARFNRLLPKPRSASPPAPIPSPPNSPRRSRAASISAFPNLTLPPEPVRPELPNVVAVSKPIVSTTTLARPATPPPPLVIEQPITPPPPALPLLANLFYRLAMTNSCNTALERVALAQARARFTHKMLQLYLRQQATARYYFTPVTAQQPAGRVSHAAPSQYQTLSTNEATWLYLWRQQIQREQAQIPQLNAYFAQAQAEKRLFSLEQVRPLRQPAPTKPLAASPAQRLPPTYLIGRLGAVVCRPARPTTLPPRTPGRHPPLAPN